MQIVCEVEGAAAIAANVEFLPSTGQFIELSGKKYEVLSTPVIFREVKNPIMTKHVPYLAVKEAESQPSAPAPAPTETTKVNQEAVAAGKKANGKVNVKG